jgi:uncharacterized cupredoxin-like copper-binding protein
MDVARIAQAVRAHEVRVTLSDFHIESPTTTFSAGTAYRFVLQNTGAVAHEWTLMPRGETDHHKHLVEVEQDQLGPGRRTTKEFTFPRSGQFEFACHIPGHYEAGMLLPITVD